jgi:hypothetical protein
LHFPGDIVLLQSLITTKIAHPLKEIRYSKTAWIIIFSFPIMGSSAVSSDAVEISIYRLLAISFN